jgi:hypothetical protein
VVFCVFVGKPLMKEFPHNSGIAIMVVAVVHTFLVRNSWCCLIALCGHFIIFIEILFLNFDEAADPVFAYRS